MASPNLKGITNETEMQAGELTNIPRMEITTPEQFANLVERCVTTDPSDPRFVGIVIDFSTFLATLSGNFSEMNQEEFSRCSQMTEIMSSRYRDNPELLKYLNDWIESREKLIKITDSAADELDQNRKAIYISQIFSLTFQMLNSFNLNIYRELSSIITSYSFKISLLFGLIIECSLPLVPYLQHTSAALCYLENLRSDTLNNRVLKAIKDDLEMFKSLKEWFDETDEFEDSVKKLFPYEIDRKIIEAIEKNSKDLGEERKIFATAVLFLYKKDPNLYKNKNIFLRIHHFCKCDAAKEWYRRMLTGASPLNLESSMIYIRKQLQQLEEMDAEPESAIQFGKYFSVQTVLPRLLLCGMNGMAVYSCYKKLKSGTNHRHAIVLRELVRNAKSFLHTMEEIRIKRSSLAC